MMQVSFCPILFSNQIMLMASGTGPVGGNPCDQVIKAVPHQHCCVAYSLWKSPALTTLPNMNSQLITPKMSYINMLMMLSD